MVGGIVHNVCILWRPSKTPLMARESKESQVGGMCVGRDKRGWKRGSNSVAFSFTVREGIVLGEATRAQTGGQPWKAWNAWIELAVLSDWLSRKVKGGTRPKMTLLTEMGVTLRLFTEMAKSQSQTSTCQNLCYYHVEMPQLAFIN